jgi:hypothetical protein
MGWIRDHLTSAGRARRLAHLRGDEMTTFSDAAEEFHSESSVAALVNFGSIGPTITLRMGVNDIQNTLQSCAWAYLGVTKNAEAVAALPPVIQSYRSGQWVKDESHPLNKLIQAPLGPRSEGPNWSWATWLKVAAIHLQMSDYGFVARKVGGLFDGWPLALWPAITSALEIDQDTRTWPYRYRHGTEAWSPAEVVHLRRAHPSSFTLSMSAFRAALPSIRIDAIARQRVEANLTNRIAPGCVITVKGLMTISAEKRKATIDAVRSQVGLSTQDGTPLIGGEGWEIIAPPPNAGETGASPARVEARREILSTIGYPETIATVVESDRSSSLERIAHWWRTTLSDLGGDLYGGLTTDLVPQSEIGKTRIWYDISGSDIALALLQSRAVAAKALTDLGYSANDAARRVQLDMPDRPELDKPNQPAVVAGRVPVGKPAPAADDAPDEEEEGEDSKP